MITGLQSRPSIQGLFLDCDGTLCETEVAVTLRQFNQAFQVFHQMNPREKLIQWSEEEYADLLKAGDSKQRFLVYFERQGLWPEVVVQGIKTKLEFAADMQRLKNEQFDSVFSQVIGSGELKLRPGVKRLVDDAIRMGVPVAVCSNSNFRPVNSIVKSLLDVAKHDIPVYGGDSVSRKKPHPEIYVTAAEKFNIQDFSKCLVIEDSNMGLLAAKKAGMRCIVTTSRFSKEEDFSSADVVVNDLDSAGLTFEGLDKMMEKDVFESALLAA